MCGIFGYVGPQNALQIVLSGLKKLEYRGYDSAGIVGIRNGELLFAKQAGKLEKLESAINASHMELDSAIGHTRWATHGKPNFENAHPHFDTAMTVGVVHNGIIENHQEFRRFLQNNGVVFRSDTDTEVIPHLIAHYYQGDLLEAVLTVVSLLKGAFALGIIHRDHPDTIIAVAKECPLAVGIGTHESFISSDSHAFSSFTRDVLFLSASEVALVRPGKCEVYDVNRNPVKKGLHRIEIREGELILQDNIWGSEEEDVMRRDFTINGLFYNPTDQTVIDYIGGLDDIHKGVLTTIGDPVVRFKQDPVRMIRLLKFRARFGFKIDPATKKALITCREEITKSSPARLLEEIYRMLESGASAPFLQLMTESWMLELLLPELTRFIKSEKGKIIYHYLSAADQFNQKNPEQPLHRAVMTACLLFPLLDTYLARDFTEKGLTPNMGDIILHTNDIMKKFVTTSFSHFPRRLILTTNFILHTQYRFMPLSKKHSLKANMFHYKEFPLAMQFFKIRAAVDPAIRDNYLHWNEHYMQHRKTPHHHHRKKKQHA